MSMKIILLNPDILPETTISTAPTSVTTTTPVKCTFIFDISKAIFINIFVYNKVATFSEKLYPRNIIVIEMSTSSCSDYDKYSFPK